MSMLERVLDALGGVDSSGYDKVPPLHRLCWRIGILIPPPILAGFWFNVVFLGLIFGVVWSAVMNVFFAVQIVSWPWITTLLAAAAAGAFFGFFMAIYARKKATRYELPTWQSLVDAERNMR